VGVVGVGNVAVDLARMILTTVDVLRYSRIFPLKYPAKCKVRRCESGKVRG
jgi:hypothetical protein